MTLSNTEQPTQSKKARNFRLLKKKAEKGLAVWDTHKTSGQDSERYNKEKLRTYTLA